MNALRRVFAMALAVAFASGPALAADPLEAAQLAELDRVRTQVAGQVQLTAYDLLDELVLGWIQEPVFTTPTPVVLAGLTVPVGLGTGLQALLENHLGGLLTQNPGCNVQLSHCPSCTAVVVHSGPEGTVVSRGIDSPALLQELGSGGRKYALFVDVEAEGTWLVLRARMTELNPDLPIVWSRTLSHASSVPAMLRQPDDLKTVAEARQDYLAALESRGPLAVPVRIGVRAFAAPDGNTLFETDTFDTYDTTDTDTDTGLDTGGIGIAPPPFYWVQSGIELGMSDARAWISSFVLGYSVIPQAYQGLMGEVRFARLLTGNYRSLTRPDLYAFGGAAVMTVWGPATGSFTNNALNTDDILNQLEGDDPRAVFGTFQAGLDLRVGNRMGMSAFFEFLPSFRNSDNFGAYLSVFGLGIQSFGTEVTFWL